MHRFTKTIALAACAAFATAGSLHAAVFSYDGMVTSSLGPAVAVGDPNLPPIGTLGTVELYINDTNPLTPIFDGFDVVESFRASVDVPGFISGSMVNNPNPSDFFSLTTEFLAFGSYGPSAITDPGTETFLPSARHSFRIEFGATLGSVPTTVGEVVAALSLPGVTGYFSHELEGSPGFLLTRVSFTDDVSAVPLPASAWMLIAALGAMGAARRRRV